MHISYSARAQSFLYDVERIVLAYEDDFGARGEIPDAPGGLDSIQLWETEVQQNQVWFQFFGFLNRF